MSNIWCWWCCHPFETIPLELPHKYDTHRNKFYTSGTFCSWSCMKSYAIEKHGVTRGSIMCGNIVTMRRKLFDKIGSIKFAPKRQRLKVFGGDLDIEQFRENNITDTEHIKKIVTEEISDRIIPIVSNTNSKMKEIKNASGKNETLRLKREKPLKRDQNNLESVLGLVIKTTKP